MNPFLDVDGLRLFEGDAASVLAELPDASVDLCVTSPPFFNLRDYGTGRWEGGDPACEHQKPPGGGPPGGGGFRATGREQRDGGQYGGECPRCGAVRVDDQIGLERTPDLFVERLVGVFREVRRLLRPTGVLLLEVGDSYSAGARGNYAGDHVRPQTKQTKGGTPTSYPARPVLDGVPGKNLLGMPWRLVFALQADGWFLRGDYIWNRPNPMPSSARDRCTIAHSYVFHLTKRPVYFWDDEAIREDAVMTPQRRFADEREAGGRGYPSGGEHNLSKKRRVRPGVDTRGGSQGSGEMEWEASGRNARSVWTIPTEPKGFGICPVCLAFWSRNAPETHCGVDVLLHYAAFPAALAEKAILAGTSAAGVCGSCGTPWERVVESKSVERYELDPSDPRYRPRRYRERGAHGPERQNGGMRFSERTTLGFEASCGCGTDPVPAVVLDPFSGSGTTLLEARRLGRQGVGVELNRLYCEMTARRLNDPAAVERALVQAVEPVQLVIG